MEVVALPYGEMTPEEALAALRQAGPMEAMILEIGSRDDLQAMDGTAQRDAARMLAHVARHAPDLPQVRLSVGGWDQDAREVWQIPEAMGMFARFINALGAAEPDSGRFAGILERMDETSRALCAASLGLVTITTGPAR